MASENIGLLCHRHSEGSDFSEQSVHTASSLYREHKTAVTSGTRNQPTEKLDGRLVVTKSEKA